MPRKRKKATDDGSRDPVLAEILDQFVENGRVTARDIELAMRRFKKALIERALGAELTHHLRYPAGGVKPDATGSAVTTLQTCIVHLIRHSLEYAGGRDRRALASGSPASGLPGGAPGRMWCPAFAPEIRRLLYTTNALENVHRQLRNSA